MGGVKSLFKGPPKPKKDPEAERLLKQQLEQEQAHQKSLDAQASAVRKTHGGGGYTRSILNYSGPKQPKNKAQLNG